MANEQIGSNTASNNIRADFIRQYRLQKRKCDEENGILRSIQKAAKSHGMTTASLKKAVELTKVEPEQAALEIRDTLHYLGLMHVSLPRETLFDWDAEVSEETERANDLWAIGEAAYQAGRAGASSDDCPYDEGDERYDHWMAEWTKGANSRARELPAGVEQARATRGRRGRKARQQKLGLDEPQQAAEPEPEGQDDYQVGAAQQPDDEPVTEYAPAPRTRRRRRTAAAAA
jgi:ribosome modulation factor